MQTIDYLVDNFGFKKVVVPVNGLGSVAVDDVVDRVSSRTLLVTIMMANNEVGTVQPIAEIARRLKAHPEGENVYFHTDASQAVGKIPANVVQLGADFMTVAGHKIYAPKGIGALYIKSPSLKLDKFMHGANHESSRRAGTENVLLAVGLGEACRILTGELDAEMKHLSGKVSVSSVDLLTSSYRSGLRDSLFAKIEQKLGPDAVSPKGIPVKPHWNGDRANMLPNTLSIGAYCAVHSVLRYLCDVLSIQGFTGGLTSPNLMKVASGWVSCSAGAACHTDDNDDDDETNTKASAILRAMNLPPDIATSTLRLSVGRYTKPEDIEVASTVLVNVLTKGRCTVTNECNAFNQPTKQLYFEDSYRFTGEASIMRVVEDSANEAKLGKDVVEIRKIYGVYTSETIMHPQGGGQPSDIGQMSALNPKNDSASMFHVLKVQAKAGVICHYGWFEGKPFDEGDSVKQLVDEEARRLHARLHSAGHCLDEAVRMSGHKELIPTKGCHFPHSCFVEYKGVVPESDRAKFKEAVERNVNALIDKAIPTKTQVVNAQQAARLCGEEAKEESFEKSNDIAIRVVQVGSDLGCPCGGKQQQCDLTGRAQDLFMHRATRSGTHVKNTKEIGRVTLRKVKCKKGMTQISYELINSKP